MASHLDAGGQVLLFLNRRGYAPALYCTGCGWIAGCSHCDARLVWHRRAARLACHHCGQESRVPERCPACQAPLSPVGEGTERLEDVLARHFPGVAAARIDRDSTRRRGEMERLLSAVQRGETRILVGTQMLAKGHDFPDVSLVGVVHADQGLFGTDFRAGERLAQTLLQVAGRAGRADRPGEVLVQTAYPEHPLLGRLLAGGYEAFAEAALAERRHAGWPPYSHLALLRAEAANPETALEFLAGCRARLPAREGVTLLGPAPAPMEKRGGSWRAQLLLQSARRRVTPAPSPVLHVRGRRWGACLPPRRLAGVVLRRCRR
jgi:primosomal protein N' (replication factor Y)